MWRDEVEVQMHMVDAFIEPIIRNAMEQKRLRERERAAEQDVQEGESSVEHLVQVADSGFSSNS